DFRIAKLAGSHLKICGNFGSKFQHTRTAKRRGRRWNGWGRMSPTESPPPYKASL
ncbi:hypothetical protein P3X46_009794, partial [Hevea brasiliensis]